MAVGVRGYGGERGAINWLCALCALQLCIYIVLCLSRSAYHVRELEVYRLMQLREPVDVGLSHDW